MRTTRVSAVLSVMAIVGIGFAACDGSDGEGTSSPTATAATTPTSTATAPTSTVTATPTLEDLEDLEDLEAEVAEAYIAYWDAYAESVLELDVTPAQGLVSDAQLALLREEIDALRVDGFAMRVVVEHDFDVVISTEEEAAVIDRIVNNSFYVDPVTKEPSEGDGTGELIEYTFLLERIDRRWIIASGFQEGP